MASQLLWVVAPQESSGGRDRGGVGEVALKQVSSAAAASEIARAEEYDGILLDESVADHAIGDLRLALEDGNCPLPVFVLDSEDTLGFRARLRRLGVDFYPLTDYSAETIDRALLKLTTRSSSSDWERMLIGESPSMKRTREIVRLVADRSSTVLITGETGTGKEVVARALHMASDRSERDMITVNSASLPTDLLESEMFGHVKGAFTGADRNRIGRFEEAHNSTILLDEIGDMPLQLQPKLLRALQEKEIQQVGSSTSVRVDARVIAATNCDLTNQVAEGRFRQDLYYRLHVVQIHLEPLRQRREDITPLAYHFVDKICQREVLPLKRLASGVVEHLSEQTWRGNIRELEHAVERAIVLSGARSTLDIYDFEPFSSAVPLRTSDEASVAEARKDLDFEAAIGRLERTLIGTALQESRGNKARAAELLGLKRSTLISKTKALAMSA